MELMPPALWADGRHHTTNDKNSACVSEVQAHAGRHSPQGGPERTEPAFHRWGDLKAWGLGRSPKAECGKPQHRVSLPGLRAPPPPGSGGCNNERPFFQPHSPAVQPWGSGLRERERLKSHHTAGDLSPDRCTGGSPDRTASHSRTNSPGPARFFIGKGIHVVRTCPARSPRGHGSRVMRSSVSRIRQGPATHDTKCLGNTIRIK